MLGDGCDNATVRDKVCQTATWDSSLARSHFAWDREGCVLVEHFEGLRFGQAYRYLSIWGAAGDTVRPIQQLFVHSQHGLLGLSQGGWKPAGDTLIVGDSAFVRERWIYERDGGRTWFPTSHSRYLRLGSN